MPPETSNPFTILSSTIVFENPKVALVSHHVANPGGGEQDYAVLHFKEAGIRILPIDHEGHTFLVGQYRFGAGYYSWELPAGGRSPDEAPKSGAARELEEEAGVAARSWLPLFRFVPSGSVTDETPVAFLAWDLEPRERRPDQTEVLEVRRLPFAEALRMTLDGSIRDTSTIATILGAHVKAQRGELPAAVARHLR